MIDADDPGVLVGIDRAADITTNTAMTIK